ncbi:MAG: thrombospondin type 3 repeat-containing protein [Caldilineaceae bacterium]
MEDGADNAPLHYNPDQEDADADGVGDPRDTDDDGDDIDNVVDNCPTVYNPSQDDEDATASAMLAMMMPTTMANPIRRTTVQPIQIQTKPTAMVNGLWQCL